MDKTNNKHRDQVTVKTDTISGTWGHVGEYRCIKCFGDYDLTIGYEDLDNGLCEGCDLDERGLL